MMCSMNAMSMPCVLTLLVAMTAPVLLGIEEMASIAQVHTNSIMKCYSKHFIHVKVLKGNVAIHRKSSYLCSNIIYVNYLSSCEGA